MGEMSSFYGGKKGESFVIKKRFDGIDIPQPNSKGEYTYIGKFYAIEPNGTLILENGLPIVKSGKNINDYAWKFIRHEGQTLNGYAFKKELARGLIQCFSEGASSTNEINYGEYAIIDTWIGLGQKANPDNGKIYQRGMNTQNELYGGEYIGQIVGPQGETSQILFDTEDSVKELPGYKEEYSKIYKDGEGLVPGSFVRNGKREYNDNISYSYVNLRDELGNIESCMIGLTIPYTTFAFKTKIISPYTIDGNAINSIGQVRNANREDISAEHPFYEEWTLEIPKGIKGDSVTEYNIVYYEVSAGTPVIVNGEEYNDNGDYEDKYVYLDEDNQYRLKNKACLSEPVKYYLHELDFGEDDTPSPYLKMWNEQTEKFEEPDNNIEYTTFMKYVKTCLAYEIISYEEKEKGESLEDGYIVLGPYDVLDDIHLRSDGRLIVKTSYNNPLGVELGKLKWIKKINLDEYGVLKIDYNDPKDDSEIFGPIKYIKELKLEQDGDFNVTFNTKGEDGNLQKYNSTLKWVEDVEINQNGEFIARYNTGDEKEPFGLCIIDKIIIKDDGTVEYFYSSNSEQPVGDLTQQKKLKWIDDVKFDGDNGLGTQKISVKYNNSEDYEEIGDSINYILEAVITEVREDCPNTDPYHLAILYSDKAYRDSIPENKRLEYVSRFPKDKNEEQKDFYIRDDWYDMGNVRGAKGGMNVITHLDNSDLLKDDSYNKVPIPPSHIKAAKDTREKGQRYIYNKDSKGDSYYDGWGVTVGPPSNMIFWFYDYSVKEWFKAGDANNDKLMPDQIVKIDEIQPDREVLEENGIWFGLTEIKVAN